MPSVKERAEVVHEYLLTKVSAEHILGPLDPAEYPQVHTSQFGVIPKSTPGKRRLIVDMCSPNEASVTDGIKESLCSLSYVTIMDAAKGVAAFGRGSLMAKVDIRNTYRVVPVHLEDRWLMGMTWKGEHHLAFQPAVSTEDIYCSSLCFRVITWRNGV